MRMDRHQPQLLAHGTIIADSTDGLAHEGPRRSHDGPKTVPQGPTRFPMSRSAPAGPPGRYDERSRRPRPAVVAAIVVVITVFGAWVLWAALGAASPDVRSELVSF